MKKLNKFLNECKKQNVLLVKKKLSIQTFSNASIRIDKNYFVIKPSGVLPHQINVNDCPVIRINDGKKVKGKYNPSTDTPTHQVLYKKYSNLWIRRTINYGLYIFSTKRPLFYKTLHR